ncbi:MAG: beta-ketoacyl-[acyl-carrier-protein] synthase II, partial [Gemmatimonadaceae bacterium]
IIPPTINYSTPDPECDLDVTPNAPKARPVSITVSNSSGFGGHNVSIALRRWHE